MSVVLRSTPLRQPPRVTVPAPNPSLTPREREVLGLTAQGLSSREMAARLGISPRTADVHRTRVIHKLGVRNRVEVTRFALEHSLLSSDTMAGDAADTSSRGSA